MTMCWYGKATIFFGVASILLCAYTARADVANIVPATKSASDTTTEAITEITTDNSAVNPDSLSVVTASDGTYTVDKSAVMHFDTFDITAIPAGSTISGAVLNLQFGVENGYDGTNSVRYDNGAGLTNTTITPTDITGFSANQTYNLFTAGVDTLSELGAVDIEFTNNDSGGADAVHFDYLWITVTYTPQTTTIANGTNPSNASIAPGASATELDTFTLQTSGGTDTVTAVTVTLAAGTSGGLSLVEITNSAGTTVYCSQSNPASSTVSLSACGVPVTTTLTSFKVRVTPKSHANMPAPPGSTYSVTGTITAFTSTNTQAGTDTNSATITIDNASPANVTSASGTAGDTQVSLSWTNPADSDFHSVVVLRATSAVTDTPAEGSTYTVGNTIGGSTVVCVVASPTASCTSTGLTNGTAYHYKNFSRDSNVNYATGAVPTGSPFTPVGAPVTTIANGTNPSNASIAPGASATELDSFTLQTNTGTDTVTAATVTLAAGTSEALSLVEITNSAGTTVYCSQSNPSSSTVSLSACGIPVTTTLTSFTIRITPKSHANMPAPPGSTYSVTGTVTAFTSTNSQSGTDTNSGTITIDNASPSNVTSASGTAGDTQVSLSWTNPADSDFHSVVVLRSTSAVSDSPAEGSTYTVGNTIGASSVVCVEESPAANCTNTGLTNGTAYHYKKFSRDSNVNYATGVVPTGSPFTPAPSADTTAPAAITNLAASGPTHNTVNLTWTSPGDDGSSGTATTYDVRRSTSEITAGNFDSATAVSGEPIPQVAGSNQSMTVNGLSASTLYYFAMKTSDEVPNASAISNVVNSTTTAAPDTTAPAAVTNLAIGTITSTSIAVTWTAPGDDGSTGTASTYDLRYATSEITAGNFSSATAVTGEPTPSVAGSSESMTISGLTASTLYYFALKTADEVPNTSAISNVVNGTTSAAVDTAAPAAVTNLATGTITSSSVAISWTAPGDDGSTGTASTYDVRYSTLEITPGNFSSATAVTGEPTPSVAGSSESMTISGLTASTLYYFALKTADEVPNTSAISNVVNGTTSASGPGPSPPPPSPSPSPEPSPSPSPSTSSGGAGGGTPRKIIFSGHAYPAAKIEVLRKSSTDPTYVQVPSETVQIDTNGLFVITYNDLMSADYFFALRAFDKEGRSAGVITLNITFSGGLYEVRDIVISPTIIFKKFSVTKSEIASVGGYAAPNSMVELELDGLKYKESKASSTGLWNIEIDPTYLRFGDHSARAKQLLTDGKTSNFSPTRTFRVSRLLSSQTDFNDDSIVDIKDWSIFLFRWGSEDTTLRTKIDLNSDGKVNVFDFSIFLQAMKL